MSSSPHNVSPPTRDRLLEAAKHLFAGNGFENTSTVAIARAAQTSESQLVKHFGSKEGLLEAIFERAWEQMSGPMQAIQKQSTPAEKLRALLELLVGSLERDFELKELLLLEGRRIRKEGHLIMLTGGFMTLVKTLDAVLAEMKAAGQLRPDLPVEAARSGLMGLFEGMMRDQVLAKRAGYPANFAAADVRRMFALVVASLAPGR